MLRLGDYGILCSSAAWLLLDSLNLIGRGRERLLYFGRGTLTGLFLLTSSKEVLEKAGSLAGRLLSEAGRVETSSALESWRGILDVLTKLAKAGRLTSSVRFFLFGYSE